MIKNIKLRSIVSNIKDKILTEGKLSDWPGYNTPAAIKKEKEIEGKKVKPEDSITDLDLNTLNRNRTIKEYSYGPLNPDDDKGSKPFWEDKAEFWNTTPEAAKESRCSNCGAFDQKKSTLNKIAKASSGFLYMVAVFGTTGVQTKIHKYTIDALKSTKHSVGARIPVGIGFGISTGKDVKKYASIGADAMIVGSANIKIMENTPTQKLEKRICSFTKKLKNQTR